MGTRRFVLVGVVLALALAVAGPSAAIEEGVAGCTASTGVTAEIVTPASAPACEFELFCDVGGGDACFYSYALEVSGTGFVRGEIFARSVLDDSSTSGFYDSGSAATASCGPSLFGCGARTTVADVVNLFIEGGDLVSVLCVGGGLAAFESVSCALTFLGVG